MMSRLTKKIENPQYMNDYELLVAFDYHLYNKLGKIEDLMEQYNINDLTELKVALDYYEQTKKVEKLTANAEADTFKEIQDLLTKSNTYDKLSTTLGCPLDVVATALKEGIIDDCDILYRPIEISLGVQLYKGTLVFVFKNFDQQEAVMCANLGLSYFPNFWLLKDYQKTWWLKSDRSE